MYSAIRLGTRTFTRNTAYVNLKESAQVLANAITNEAKQAVTNSSLGSSGYLGVSPSIGPGGVLYPNENSTGLTTNYIQFNEINGTNFDPTVSGFSRTNPENYLKVRYYTLQGVVYREQITYDSTGTVLQTTNDAFAQLDNGIIDISVSYVSKKEYELVITVTKDGNSFTTRRTIYIFTV